MRRPAVTGHAAAHIPVLIALATLAAGAAATATAAYADTSFARDGARPLMAASSSADTGPLGYGAISSDVAYLDEPAMGSERIMLATTRLHSF